MIMLRIFDTVIQRGSFIIIVINSLLLSSIESTAPSFSDHVLHFPSMKDASSLLLFGELFYGTKATDCGTYYISKQLFQDLPPRIPSFQLSSVLISQESFLFPHGLFSFLARATKLARLKRDDAWTMC